MRKRTYAVILLATLQVVAQLATTVHLASVPHVSCADDGELVHAHAPGALASPKEQSLLTSDARPNAAHHHDHCPLAFLHGALAAQRHEQSSIRSADPVKLLRPHDSDGPHHGLPTLLIAPKTSPPSPV